jgi:hypothetical protein
MSESQPVVFDGQAVARKLGDLRVMLAAKGEYSAAGLVQAGIDCIMGLLSALPPPPPREMAEVPAGEPMEPAEAVA